MSEKIISDKVSHINKKLFKYSQELSRNGIIRASMALIWLQVSSSKTMLWADGGLYSLRFMPRSGNTAICARVTLALGQ